MTGIAGLRNILVHDYVTVDEAQVWQVLDDHLEDLGAAHQALGRLPELIVPGS